MPQALRALCVFLVHLVRLPQMQELEAVNLVRLVPLVHLVVRQAAPSVLQEPILLREQVPAPRVQRERIASLVRLPFVLRPL